MSTFKHISRYNLIFWAVLLAGALALLLSVTAGNTFKPFADEELSDFSEGWTTADGRSVSLHALAEAVGTDGTVTVQKTLPTLIPDGCDLNFRSKNIDFTVTIGGKPVYSFYPEPEMHNIAGRSYGSCFHHIPIPRNDAGKTIAIAARPDYTDNSSFFSLLCLGNSGAYYARFMQRNLPAFLVCVLIFFFGVIMLLLALTISRVQGRNYDLLSLGALAIMLGVWSAMETLVPQLLTGTTTFFHGLNYLLLILMPYPAVQFVNAQLVRPRRHLTTIAFWVVMGDLVFCTAMNYSGIRDFHECLPLIHTIFILTVLCFVVLLWKNAREIRKSGADGRNRPMLSAFFIFLALCMLDLWRYIATDRGSDDAGYFMRIGLLFYIIVLFIRSLRQILDRMQLASETEAIRRVAYTDALTGLGNRAAFLEKEHELEAAVQSGELREVLVCQMDINDLKHVNDSFGHACGDEYIRTAADLIAAAFGADGACYRIGGDEFTVFITQQPADEIFARCQETLRTAVAHRNSESSVRSPLHIACGSALFRSGDKSLEQTEIEADQHMYAHKRDMKAN